MFHWENGLKLTRPDLAIDFPRAQARAFVSHGHADHIARHAYALCTRETASFYHHRLGQRPIREMTYRESIDWGGLRLTAYPAGHCLGSAMLLADDGEQSLLYTGDFKLGPSATAEECELPRADILIMECTFGTPAYRFPPRESVIARLCDAVREVLQTGRTPVITAYVLGKAQEVTRILADAGFQVLQHPKILEISQMYERHGVALGDLRPLRERDIVPGEHVVIVPPNTRRLDHAKEVRIAVTGWALDAGAKYRLRVEHAIPLSDHAGYDELIEAIERVAPKKVYCTHGPLGFVDRLQDLGFNAFHLGRPTQQRLF